MNIEEFKDLSIQETQERLQARLDEHIKKVEEIKDIDTLKQLEQDIIKEQDEFGEHLKTVEYELKTDGVEFEGKNYSQSEIHKKILYFFSRIEQKFEYCAGLHSLVRMLKQSDLKTINYGSYDSILRLLGGLQFRGDSEWCDIIIINNYLSFAHEKYIKDRTCLLVLAEMHNKILDRIKTVTPVEQLQAQE